MFVFLVGRLPRVGVCPRNSSIPWDGRAAASRTPHSAHGHFSHLSAAIPSDPTQQ